MKQNMEQEANEMELIDRRKLYMDMLNEMSGTGYQSQTLSVIGQQQKVDAAPIKYCHPITRNRCGTVTRYEPTDSASSHDEQLYRKIVYTPEYDPVEYCSECGKRLCSRFRNYCPNCGAKIILEDNKNGTQ